MPECADEELPAYDRIQLLKKARWLTNNFGLPARAIDGVARYTCGKGICPQARTSNRDWNQSTEKAFEAKVGTAAFGFDVAAQVNFYESQPLILKQMMTDGDFFAQLTRSESGAGMASLTRANIGNRYDDNTFVDGVK
jgi:capsid protein